MLKETTREADLRMKGALDNLESDLAGIRTGRASPGLVEKIPVEYYGAPTPVNQLAAVSVTEARTLTIQPWDASVLRQIEKAIQTSDIGINPQNDGKIIRLIFPPLTEDRRKEIVKDVQKIAEETKIQIRNVRRELIDKLKAMKKDGELTEDDLKQGEKKAQDLTDKYVKEVESISAVKQKEILEM